MRVLGQLCNVAATAQGHHLIGRWIAPQEIQRILANGAGGAKD